ncbi:hypothetical protein COT29_02320 [Candidatus Micrarchaeota archaeon CG08_land_8_20_14_0_20_59_11]|nr:MAG: hypothetical protein COT29_02320 [Candidatus Micrarchaeota archaeon CG08_land_8_20_14_0_20_59_11]
MRKPDLRQKMAARERTGSSLVEKEFGKEGVTFGKGAAKGGAATFGQIRNVIRAIRQIKQTKRVKSALREKLGLDYGTFHRILKGKEFRDFPTTGPIPEERMAEFVNKFKAVAEGRKTEEKRTYVKKQGTVSPPKMTLEEVTNLLKDVVGEINDVKREQLALGIEHRDARVAGDEDKIHEIQEKLQPLNEKRRVLYDKRFALLNQIWRWEQQEKKKKGAQGRS